MIKLFVLLFCLNFHFSNLKHPAVLLRFEVLQERGCLLCQDCLGFAGMFICSVRSDVFFHKYYLFLYVSKKKSSEIQVIASLGASGIKIETTLVKVSGISLEF